MSSMEDEIVELKSYFKHHRIVTYAMLGFMVVSTLATTVAFQSLNQQTDMRSRAAEQEPSATPTPTVAPNCGAYCFIPSVTSCVGGAQCFPCTGGSCTEDVGICGGVICNPYPTPY